ncbi:MAG: hypothetical protein CR981_01630 [Proteobacteria bacterium]|nr:MAG: hypothetical protein CR981_01630 [Pseudomonadota bacterium]
MHTITPPPSISGPGSSTSGQTGQKQSHTDHAKTALFTSTLGRPLSTDGFILDIGASRITTNSKTELSIGQQLQLKATMLPQSSKTPYGGTSKEVLIKATILESLSENRFLLDIGGTRIIAQFKQPIKSGQQLQYEISSLLRENSPDPNRADSQQMETAVVTEKLSDNRYVLKTNNNRIIVDSKTALQIGQSLELDVTGTQPDRSTTTIPNPFSLLAGKSLPLLHNSLQVSTLFSTLQQTPLSPPLSPAAINTLELFLPQNNRLITDTEPRGTFVKEIVHRLGINLEPLLARQDTKNAAATLKATLLEIVNTFKESKTVIEQAGTLLSTIEAHQYAQLQLNHQDILLFPLPFSFINYGYLMIENYREGKSGKAENDQISFSLHLSMSGLGNIKICVHKKNNGLYIQFYLESEEKAAFLSLFQEKLNQLISSNNLQSVTFSTGAEKPETELIRKMFPNQQSILNTTI